MSLGHPAPELRRSPRLMSAGAGFEPVCTSFFLSLSTVSSISVTVPIKFYQKQQQSNNVFDLFIASLRPQRDCLAAALEDGQTASIGGV